MFKILSYINKGDKCDGVTFDIMALPLAFGIQSGLDASAKLYNKIVVGIFFAFFVGTYKQIKDTTCPLNVVSVATVVLLKGTLKNLESRLPIIFYVGKVVYVIN